MVAPVTSGLVIHLDADSITGLADGDSIATWSDESGTGNNASAQGTSGASYATNASPTGKPAVRLDGDGYLECASDASYRSGRVTMFMVANSESTETYISILGVPQRDDGAHSPDYWRYYIGHRGDNGTFAIRWDGTEYEGGTLTGYATPSIWRLFDGQGFRDGVSEAGSSNADTITYPNPSPFLIGANGAGEERLTGNVFEVLVYDRDLTAQEITDVENYLDTKWLDDSATTTYTLTTSTTGNGSVTLTPSGGTYNDGDTVTVEAVPDSGWSFDSWSGDLSGSTNPETVTMDADKTVTATFTEDVGTAPTGLTGAQQPSVALSWDASDGNYDVRRDGTIVTTGLTSTEWIDTDVTAGQSYDYEVRSDGGDWSAPVTVSVVEGVSTEKVRFGGQWV